MDEHEELSTVYQKDSQGYQNWMTSSRAFLNGFLMGLFSFILANLFAAHLLSDCVLPVVLGMDSCADNIARAGFPFIFFEAGGFAFRSIFNPSYLFLDILTVIIFAVLCGFFAQRFYNQRAKD